MQFFSNIQDEIIARINESTSSIKIAVTWFTNHDIFNALLKKFQSPSYQLDLIVLNDRINNKNEGVNFQKLIDLNGNFYYSSIENMVHHKFCIIDDKTIITGSYNWTYCAENNNWENIIISDDIEIVKAYIQEFEKIVQHHEKVENVSLVKRVVDKGIDSKEYLITDYNCQALQETRRDDNLTAAKLYTESLILNNEQEDIKTERTVIINKIYCQRFETCPFEIGIVYFTGYHIEIPAFSKLSQEILKKGLTNPVNFLVSKIDIQIKNYNIVVKTCRIELGTPNSRRDIHCPIGTQKLYCTLTVSPNGILTIFLEEVTGDKRRNVGTWNLKELLKLT